MKNSYVRFYHPGETFDYKVHKVVCKTIWQDKKNCLLIDLETTEDLDHVEEDALQNRFPKLAITLEDFPVDGDSIEDLSKKTISIPNSFDVLKDKDGEPYEVYYTNISVGEDELESIENEIFISKNESEFTLHWNGLCPNFDNENADYIKFEIVTDFSG